MRDALGKYKNIYNYNETIEPVFKGDAMTETNGWHGANNLWGYVSGNSRYEIAVIVRAYSGSLFSYCANFNLGDSSAYDSTIYSTKLYSRAAMVCGEGI